MTRASTNRSVCAAALLAAVLTFGCGSNGSSPGPGGSSISGNVADADTAGLDRARGSWLAWLGEQLLSLARTAHAQTRDTSLAGIAVIARGEGREVTDVTDTAGNFILSDAPTGEVSVLFRRASCEATVFLASVVSNSTITISDLSFSCPPDSDIGDASPSIVFERFLGVVRDDPADPGADLRLCVRIGSDDHTRLVNAQGTTIEDTGGQPTTFAAFREDDLLEIQGNRFAAEDTSDTFDTQVIRIKQRDASDACDKPF